MHTKNTSRPHTQTHPQAVILNRLVIWQNFNRIATASIEGQSPKWTSTFSFSFDCDDKAEEEGAEEPPAGFRLEGLVEADPEAVEEEEAAAAAPGFEGSVDVAADVGFGFGE